MGAIRKRSTAKAAPASELRAASPPPVAPLPFTPGPGRDVSRVIARLAEPTIGLDRLLVVLEDDRRDNARNHERCMSKRENTDAAAHLAVCRYIERLTERLKTGDVT